VAGLTLAAVGAVHLLTAAAFLAVGRRFLHREVAPGHGLPRNAFVTWWWGFALYLLLQGATTMAAAAGAVSLPVAIALRALNGPVIAAAAWGLAYHILFLWSGKGWWALPLAFYYGAAGATYSLWGLLHEAEGVLVTDWAVDVQYTTPLEGPVWTFVLASFGLPLVLGSIAYLALAGKVDGRGPRYRILLVGGSLLVWVVAGFAAEVAGGHAVRFVAIVVLGLLTAAAVMAAYFPPSPVRRWLAAPVVVR
jgi:hypothetical protein